MEEKKVTNEERQKRQPVVDAPAKVSKKSFGLRMKEMFIAEDVKDVKSYLMYDILLPAIKDGIADTFRSGIDMIFYGEVRNRRGSGKSKYYRGDRPSYDYGKHYRSDSRDDRKESRRGNRSGYDVATITLPSRAAAEDVIAELYSILDEYHVLSVADFYEVCNVDSDFVDCKYGWYDLGTIVPERTHDGEYMINMPKPQAI